MVEWSFGRKVGKIDSKFEILQNIRPNGSFDQSGYNQYLNDKVPETEKRISRYFHHIQFVFEISDPNHTLVSHLFDLRLKLINVIIFIYLNLI